MPVCDEEGGRRWRDAAAACDDEPFAGFCRVIWNAPRGMTDLSAAIAHLMHIVYAVESALRRVDATDEPRLACNATPTCIGT